MLRLTAGAADDEEVAAGVMALPSCGASSPSGVSLQQAAVIPVAVSGPPVSLRQQLIAVQQELFFTQSELRVAR